MIQKTIKNLTESRNELKKKKKSKHQDRKGL